MHFQGPQRVCLTTLGCNDVDDRRLRQGHLSAPQRCNAERSDAQRSFFTSQFIPLFTAASLRCPSLFFSIARENVLHRTHRLSALASIFPFAKMVYCTKHPKDPAILKILRRSDLLSPVVIHVLRRFPVTFSQENKVFRDPAVVFYYCRSVLLPP